MERRATNPFLTAIHASELVKSILKARNGLYTITRVMLVYQKARGSSFLLENIRPSLIWPKVVSPQQRPKPSSHTF